MIRSLEHNQGVGENTLRMYTSNIDTRPRIRLNGGCGGVGACPYTPHSICMAEIPLRLASTGQIIGGIFPQPGRQFYRSLLCLTVQPCGQTMGSAD
ncbi:hypothetical protein KIPB_011465 [Kipferlia bialata]|uniref:Uncharacterized protein n=1 Tax=Kipferlia bialata TaxID=797122 RepID=A0A9K3D4U4_9EUKA|nr:hypothetical protein KIPB_011465 [Kipferlia bialata]|eukprot:g11465.t1